MGVVDVSSTYTVATTKQKSREDKYQFY